MRSQIAFAAILLDDVARVGAQVPYVELALGASGCANGTQIVSQALCQGAIATLGLNYTTNSWTERTDVPLFCSHGDGFNTNMHWNNASTGEGHLDLAPVCRETPMRYIKLQSNLAGSWAAWREIEVYASDHNGVLQNVALVGTATASSLCDQDDMYCGPNEHTPVMANDGDATTSWNSGGGAPAWIEIDLGDVYYIDRVRAVFGPQPHCMEYLGERQDSSGAGCDAYSANLTMCSDASLIGGFLNDFNGTHDCCACGGGDRARLGVNGIHDSSELSPAHALHMAGPDHEFMEFEVWIPGPIDSGEVEYAALLVGRPHGLLTCSPLETDVNFVGNEYRGRRDDHHHGGRVESAESCCALCQSEYAEGCRFWSWDGDERCYLKSSSEGRTASVGMVSGAVAQTASEAPHTQAQCEGNVQVGVDIQGFDIHGHVRAQTADECCAACSDEYANGCRFWTFHDDHCHLKSSNVTMQAREGRTSGSVGAVLLEQADTMSCAVMEEGVEYHGSGMDLPGGEIEVASAEECCDQCQGAYGLGCRFWTYKIHDGKCRRKTGIGERRDHSERISGSVGQVIQQVTEATCGEMEDGVEFHGGGSEMAGGHVAADSAAHCCELCQASYDEGCRFWTYKTDNGNCHRRSTIGDGRRQREDRISGAVTAVDSDSSNDLAGFTNAQIDGANSATMSVLTAATMFMVVM